MLGTQEEPREWEDLALGEKVRRRLSSPPLDGRDARALTTSPSHQLAAIHQVCEWHMLDPNRFRTHVGEQNVDLEAGWVGLLSLCLSPTTARGRFS